MISMQVDDDHTTKMEVDYTTACDEVIPLATDLAKSSPEKFQEAIDILLQLEKKCRLGADMVSCSRVLISIVETCFETKNWTSLNELILLLVKRRSQLKNAVTKMIQECCKYVNQTPTEEIKIKLINVLRTVSEGKIYVENERARLTKILAEIKEKNGDIPGAATLMEDLQVETYGTMEKREKVEFILDQMRLCLATQDPIRTHIISRKINTKFFDDPKQEDLKIKYYGLMIQLDQDISYFRTAYHYQALIKPSEMNESTETITRILKHSVIYAILSPYNNEQYKLMLRLSKNKIVQDLTKFKEMLESFMSKELIDVEDFNRDFRKSIFDLDFMNQRTRHGKTCWIEMKHRLIEHNIRIVSMYYKRIHLQRLSELLYLPKLKCEEYLGKLASKGVIRVKIDRTTSIVNFNMKKNPTEVLTDWSHQIGDLVNIINRTTHFIKNEICINQILNMSIDEPKRPSYSTDV